MENSMDLLFDMFVAFHGVMMAFAGFVASAIGVLIAGHAIYTRMTAQYVIGRTIGVHQSGRGSKGTMYRRIYEFKAPNGEIQKRPSSISSGAMPKEQEAQQKVKLLYVESDRYINRKGNYLQLFIGAVFCIPGFIFLPMGLQQLDANLPTFIMLIALPAYLFFKLFSFGKKNNINFKPTELKKKFAELKEQGMQRRSMDPNRFPDAAAKTTSKEDRYVRDMIPLNELKTSEAYQFENANKGNHNDIIAPIAFLAGIALIAASFFIGKDVYQTTTYGIKTAGEVVSMKTRKSTSDGTTTTMYYPIMEFETEDGDTIRFESNTGSSHPSVRTGDDVEIFYRPEDPKETAMRDKGFFMNYLFSLIMAIVGLFALFIGQDLWRKIE